MSIKIQYIMSHNACESLHYTFRWISAICCVLCIFESSLQSFKIVRELLHQYSMDHNQMLKTYSVSPRDCFKRLMSYSCQLSFDEIKECLLHIWNMYVKTYSLKAMISIFSLHFPVTIIIYVSLPMHNTP